MNLIKGGTFNNFAVNKLREKFLQSQTEKISDDSQNPEEGISSRKKAREFVDLYVICFNLDTKLKVGAAYSQLSLLPGKRKGKLSFCFPGKKQRKNVRNRASVSVTEGEKTENCCE